MKYFASQRTSLKNQNGDLIFEFTDRVIAFDGKKKAEYTQKGKITYRVAEYWSII